MRIVDYSLPSTLGAFDYLPKFIQGRVTASASVGVYSTLLSVTGKGLLSKAIAYFGGTTGTALRITIDGTVVYWGVNNVVDTFGLFNPSELVTVGTATYPFLPCGLNGLTKIFSTTPSTFPSFPHSTKQSANAPVVLINSPIKFNISLLIEIAHESTASAQIDYGVSYSLAQ